MVDKIVIRYNAVNQFYFVGLNKNKRIIFRSDNEYTTRGKCTEAAHKLAQQLDVIWYDETK